jgi:hypothetical protein
MMLWVDSCSWFTGNAIGDRGVGLKYQNKSTFGAAQAGAGRYSGNSYSFGNSGFGQILYVKPLNFGSQVFDSRQLAIVAGRNPESIIWQWLNTTLMSPAIAYMTLDSTGHLRLYSGGDGFNPTSGALLYVSQAVLDVDNYHSVDLAWSFPFSGAGSISLYVDDVLDTLTAGEPSVPNVTWAARPNAFAFCWANFTSTGYQFSDLVVNDNTGSYNTGRLGPCRVQAYVPVADAQPLSGSGWMAAGTVITSTGAAAIQELPNANYNTQAPDGDYAYITTATPGSQYVAEMGQRVGAEYVPGLDCTALILGISLSACLRDPSSVNQEFVVIPNPSNGSAFTINGGTGTTAAYNVVEAITEVRPDTLQGWTDGDASNAWWGINCAGGAPALTQLILEKVTTTRAVPFTCGQLGSYSYQ